MHVRLDTILKRERNLQFLQHGNALQHTLQMRELDLKYAHALRHDTGNGLSPSLAGPSQATSQAASTHSYDVPTVNKILVEELGDKHMDIHILSGMKPEHIDDLLNKIGPETCGARVKVEMALASLGAAKTAGPANTNS